MSGQEQDVGTPLSPPAAPDRSPPTTPSAAGSARAAPDVIDEQRFRHLFATTYRPLTAYARRRLGDPGHADDVVAEVYTTAWRRRHDLDPDAPPLPWLYGIAANLVRNHRRSQGRQLRLIDKLGAQPDAGSAADLPGPADDPRSVEVRRALATLSDDDQEVLRLTVWEGLTQAEVGSVLGCTANAVALRLRRARQRLADALTAADSTPPPATAPDTTDHPRPNED